MLIPLLQDNVSVYSYNIRLSRTVPCELFQTCISEIFYRIVIIVTVRYLVCGLWKMRKIAVY